MCIPQMNPLNWLFLFFLVLNLILFLYMFIYFLSERVVRIRKSLIKKKRFIELKTEF